MCPTDAWARIRAYVEIAEASAQCICESCGNQGKFREDYWRRVYCDACITPKDNLGQGESCD
ncbi:TPA: hypothetical protein QDA70_005375 [Burkholderia vietnamiensis]|nr:hypothetical protein [Burkholderia vietnamiensis]HDR9244707.1 hypothetical protein [Burkholderia vietnamiensis]